ncbi:hypothetical protein Tco_1093833 [Tanacetum coccineum]|uniref:Uncharacterized protein n=1 Tax=Tanacetum coccineum TaxID=301880 RepID=A0ABQ5IDV4_9ASTR
MTQALSSRIFTLELKDLPHKINQTVNEAVKEAVHSGTYKSLPEHVALYEALEASMKRANRDEFFAKKDKFRGHRYCLSSQDQDQTRLIQAYSKGRLTSNSRTRLGEYKLLWQTGDMSSFINWFCKRIKKKKLSKVDLEGPAFKVTIQTQYFFNKDLEYLVTRDKGRRSALSISKLKAAQYLDFGLEELVPSLWIESERDYDISAAYGISHCVVSLKTYERYGYTFLKEIVLRRADYNEYKISEADFKNLHPNDFKDMYLLHLQGQLNHLSGADKLGIESYQTKLNLTQPNWDASEFLFKEDYTIVSKRRVVIYRDINDQKKMMRETEVHTFSDGTLNRILDKLDHMVKDFK